MYTIDKSISKEMNTDYLNYVDQISLNCRPVFSNTTTNLFIACGRNINIYNSKSGELVGTLKGHEYEIVGICINKNDDIYSCDAQRNVYVWKSDSKDAVKHMLQKPPVIPQSYTVCYFHLGHDSSVFVGFKSKSDMATLFFYKNINSNSTFLNDLLLPHSNAVAVSQTSLTVAALKSTSLIITEVVNSGKEFNVSKHKSNTSLVCVAYNSQMIPALDVVAVGDITGKIVVYNNVREVPIKRIFHWHSLPVQDLIFSMECKNWELLSGGSENAIATWRYRENQPMILPRLGNPIKYLAVKNDNDTLIAVHNDKGVSLIDKQSNNLIGMIQALIHHLPSKDVPPSPVGLVFNPQSSLLVLNGRSGYLQTINPYTNRIIYSIDISMSNISSNERNFEIPNLEVTRVAFSNDRQWMITAEICYLNVRLTETILKFWEFIEVNQRWELNTAIQMAHEDYISSIAIDPVDCCSCVTTSQDGTFKVWTLYQPPIVGSQKKDKTLWSSKDKTFWSSKTKNGFQNMTPLACSYSPDGSLLVVAFNNILTFWLAESCKFMDCLRKSFLQEDIKELTFNRGKYEGSELVVRTDNWLSSWNLQTLTLNYAKNFASTCLAVENNSGVMVLFTKDNFVYFFESHSWNPLKVVQNLKCKNVVSATFVPSEEEFLEDVDVPWKTNSALHFMDTEQNLIKIDNIDDLNSKILNSVSNVLEEILSEKNLDHQSVFTKIVPKTKEISLNEINTGFEIETNIRKSLLDELYSISIHNLESLDFLSYHLDALVPKIKSTDANVQKSPAYFTIVDNKVDCVTITKEEEEELNSAKSMEIIDKIDFESLFKFKK